MKPSIGIWAAPVAVLLSLATIAPAETVSYSANLSTSKGNAVSDILILEANGTQPPRATIYPLQLRGRGTAVVSHDAPFVPTQSLIIGLTEGSENGIDKTQLVIFLDGTFAAANVGVPFSSVFPGARHNETIARLQAAVAGDAAALAWFTDTFFTGPAAGAVFASGGAFTVAEFTVLNMIGANATVGNWMIMSFQSVAANDPNAQSNLPTALINETAKIDTGPFDIELLVDDNGQFALDKSVLNNSGIDWGGFRMILGTGTGANFVPTTESDGLFFLASLNNREETGAFPTVVVDEEITFTGVLPVGGTARFVVFVNTATNGPHTFTLRQIAIAAAAPAPTLSQASLAILTVLLCGLAALRLRRPLSR